MASYVSLVSLETSRGWGWETGITKKTRNEGSSAVSLFLNVIFKGDNLSFF